MATEKQLPLLILHFDLNETILVTDPAGGDTLENILNKTIAKNTFIKKTPDPDLAAPVPWHGGSPKLDTSWEYPAGCEPLYRSGYKKFAKKYTEPGEIGEVRSYCFEVSA